MNFRWIYAFALLFLTRFIAAQECIRPYVQCAGRGFVLNPPGAVCCPGTYCKFIAEYYSQCYPEIEGSIPPVPQPSPHAPPPQSPTPPPPAPSPSPPPQQQQPSPPVQSPSPVDPSRNSPPVLPEQQGSQNPPPQGNPLRSPDVPALTSVVSRLNIAESSVSGSKDGEYAYTVVLSQTLVPVSSATWDSNGNPVSYVTSVVAVTYTAKPNIIDPNQQKKEEGLRNAVIIGVVVASSVGIFVMLLLIWIRRRATRKDPFTFGFKNLGSSNSRSSNGHLVSLEINTKPDIYTAKLPEKPEPMRHNSRDSASTAMSYNFRSSSSNPFGDVYDDGSVYDSEPPSAVALNLTMSSSSSRTDSIEYQDEVINPFDGNSPVPEPQPPAQAPKNRLVSFALQQNRSIEITDKGNRNSEMTEVTERSRVTSVTSATTSRSSGTLTPSWKVPKNVR